MKETLPAEARQPSSFIGERLKLLDAYRGLIMVTLAFGGFSLAGTAGLQLQGNPDSQIWKIVQHQCVHT